MSPVASVKGWPELMVDLRRPFTAAAVKFKPLTKPYDGKSSAAFYIDARLVAERLNEVVGAGNWSDEYSLIAEGRETPALFYPIVCRLTVLGVMKSDVGQGANQVVDEKAWKSAYSDALKRAAVKFGVGAYLYGLPRLYASVDIDSNGKAKGFSKEGKQLLLSRYAAWLSSPANTFGKPFDHGDVTDDEDDDTASTPPAPAERPQEAAQARATQTGNGSTVISEAQAKRLYAISKSKNVTDTAVKKIIREIGGVESSKDIPRVKYEAVCAAVEAWSETVPAASDYGDDIPFAPTIDGYS